MKGIRSKKILVIVLLIVALLGCFTILCVIKNTGIYDESYFPEYLSNETLTRKEFLDKYYQSLLYKPLNGKWKQSDITYLLERYIQEDIANNKTDSPFNFMLGNETLFFYTVDTSTGKNSISFLIEKSSVDLKYDFIGLIMFITYQGEQASDLDSYELEVCDVKNISFEDAEDFLNYIRSDNNGSVFFERGWIEIF